MAITTVKATIDGQEHTLTYGRLYDNSGAAVLDVESSEITMADNQDYTSAYSGAQMDNLAELGG